MNLSIDSGTQLVMYSQKTFRGILDSMARPGKINRMDPFPVSERGIDGQDTRYLLGLGYTLLDVEVGFHIPGRDQFPAGLETDLAFHTGSSCCPLADADFVFLTGSADPELLSQMKCGTLEFPDNGATAVMQVDYLSEDGPPETYLVMELNLKGPGVSGEKVLYAGGLTEDHVRVLRTVNVEFPLGIDLILTCGERFACIPRSIELNLRGN